MVLFYRFQAVVTTKFHIWQTRPDTVSNNFSILDIQLINLKTSVYGLIIKEFNGEPTKDLDTSDEEQLNVHTISTIDVFVQLCRRRTGRRHSTSQCTFHRS